MSLGLGISGYGTQALQSMPTIQVPDNAPFLRTLDTDLSALILYQVQTQIYQQQLTTVDPTKTKITEITPTNSAVQIAAPDPSRIGFSIENTSGVALYVGFEDTVSATRALKKYNPGEMFGFDGSQCSSAIFVIGDIPASVLAQGFALYEYFNNSPVPPTPPTLVGNVSIPPSSSSNGGVAASLAAIPQANNLISVSNLTAAAPAVTYTAPQFANQTVPVSIFNAISGQNLYSGNQPFDTNGVVAATDQYGSFLSVGAKAGDKIVVVFGAGNNAVRTPIISLS